MNNLVKDFYIKENDIFGLPQAYKTIDFYPIKLKDGRAKNLFYRIFQIPKNYINEELIKKISYLAFLLYAVQYSINPKGSEVEEMLVEFLEFITKKKVSFYCLNNEDISDTSSLVIKFNIGNIVFDERDFDVIREIILLQNGISTQWVEMYDPVLEKMQNEENSRYGELTTEEELFKFCSLLKCPINVIENYTLFQYKHHFNQQILLFQYETYAPLEISGQISAKNGQEIVKPYFSHNSNDHRYGSILIPMDDFISSHNDPDMRDEKGNITLKFEDDKQ